ncbi:hypothetical protein EV421DRAFT_1291959 [Armillaria borealis]|uniref:Uncharacterized protein n=1 Tax=Armillaria borealis TaxID=47425 RepID=A0AA39MX64_9AGAR|nr:hypothetical protein EV421DRAFT_1291959 [Armillaria borealis]
MLVLFIFQANVFESSSLTCSSPCILCRCYMWPFSLPNPFPFCYLTYCFARLTDISLRWHRTLALKSRQGLNFSLDGPAANRNTVLQNTLRRPELPKSALVIPLAIPYRSPCRQTGKERTGRIVGYDNFTKDLRGWTSDISSIDPPPQSPDNVRRFEIIDLESKMSLRVSAKRGASG